MAKTFEQAAKQTRKEQYRDRAQSKKQRLYPLPHNVSHPLTTEDTELAMNARSNLDFIRPTVQRLLTRLGLPALIGTGVN
jgi:hypothetical protein